VSLMSVPIVMYTSTRISSTRADIYVSRSFRFVWFLRGKSHQSVRTVYIFQSGVFFSRVCRPINIHINDSQIRYPEHHVVVVILFVVVVVIYQTLLGRGIQSKGSSILSTILVESSYRTRRTSLLHDFDSCRGEESVGHLCGTLIYTTNHGSYV